MANGKKKAPAKSAQVKRTPGAVKGKVQSRSASSTPRKAAATPARKPATKRKAPVARRQTATAVVEAREIVPTLALEEFEPKVEKARGVEDRSLGSTRFAWLGLGQCGGRLAKGFYDLGYGKVLALNTAYHDLNDLDLPASQKILMDIGRKGAGKDMGRGREAAEQYRQDVIHAVEQIFSENIDHLMLTFGAGGGTGSGSILPLIDTVRTCAKHIGIRDPQKRIGVLATLPTDGEAASPKVAQNSYEVITQLCQMAQEGQISPLIIVDNERIRELYPGLTVKQFWPTINSTIAGLFDIFNRLSSLSSNYTSFDSVDYQSIMEAGGCAIMGLTKVRYTGKYDISEAIKTSLRKTLLATGFDLNSAKVTGAIVVGGRRIMAETPGLQDAINHAFDVLTDLTGDATVHRGIYEDDKESLRVYTIIGGLATPSDRLEELRRVW